MPLPVIASLLSVGSALGRKTAAGLTGLGRNVATGLFPPGKDRGAMPSFPGLTGTQRMGMAGKNPIEIAMRHRMAQDEQRRAHEKAQQEEGEQESADKTLAAFRGLGRATGSLAGFTVKAGLAMAAFPKIVETSGKLVTNLNRQFIDFSGGIASAVGELERGRILRKIELGAAATETGAQQIEAQNRMEGEMVRVNKVMTAGINTVQTALSEIGILMIQELVGTEGWKELEKWLGVDRKTAAEQQPILGFLSQMANQEFVEGHEKKQRYFNASKPRATGAGVIAEQGGYWSTVLDFYAPDRLILR